MFILSSSVATGKKAFASPSLSRTEVHTRIYYTNAYIIKSLMSMRMRDKAFAISYTIIIIIIIIIIIHPKAFTSNRCN